MRFDCESEKLGFNAKKKIKKQDFPESLCGDLYLRINKAVFNRMVESDYFVAWLQFLSPLPSLAIFASLASLC